MLNITGGSDKQNAWATQIASDQLAILDREIDNTIARADSSLDWYLTALRERRDLLVTGFGKISAKQLIDLHVAQRANLAEAHITMARDAAKTRKEVA